MRAAIVAICFFFGSAAPAISQVGIGVSLPSVRIGINLPAYPDLVPIAGYPVYYAPQADANLFFYDGRYWVYAGDNWYSSSWYNGPWDPVGPAYVPYFLLRVPIIYYRRPPAYFREWNRERPPHWGQHWGGDWDRRHRDWDHWNRARVPERAPLPAYQSRYMRDHYPSGDEQRALQSRNYQYRPRDSAGRQWYSAPRHDQAARQNQPPRGGAPEAGRRRADRGAMPMRRAPIERAPPARDNARQAHDRQSRDDSSRQR